MDRSKIKNIKANRFKTKKPKAETLTSKWQAISFGGKLFMLSLIAILLCYKILDDTINARYFLFIYGSLGILVYIGLKFFFRGNKSLKFDAWGYVGSFLMFISFFTFLNYLTLKTTTKGESIVITSKGESGYKARQHYIFFSHNKKSQRFTVSRLLWDSISEGEKIKMCYQESLLGFDIVKEFKK